ncbi:MAG: TolC family protein [Wenzhouxiangellaceae bacterium]
MSYPNSLSSIVVSLALLAAAASPGALSAQQQPLRLDEAVTLAREADDPSLVSFDRRAEAFENSAVADAQLPDPMITGQIANVPTDSFEFDQDGMTQALRLGLRQEFPAGRTLSLRGEKRDVQSAIERARRQLKQREIELSVRNAWLELAWHQRAQTILATSRDAVEEQIDSLTSRFATGRVHAQDMQRSELELALIDDRVTEHRRQADVARAALARYIGNAAFRPMPESLPAFPAPAALGQLQDRLVSHPAVEAERHRIESADLDVSIAEQAYKPKFALEGGYGFRVDRPDLATIGVTLSVPLFTNKRQDRTRTAAVKQMSAVEADRQSLLMDLRRNLEQERAHWERLQERLALYAGALSERARGTAEASITTYANGQTDFAELIRSQLAELEILLKRTELETRAGQAWARIVYLAGETP